MSVSCVAVHAYHQHVVGYRSIQSLCQQLHHVSTQPGGSHSNDNRQRKCSSLSLECLEVPTPAKQWLRFWGPKLEASAIAVRRVQDRGSDAWKAGRKIGHDPWKPIREPKSFP